MEAYQGYSMKTTCKRFLPLLLFSCEKSLIQSLVSLWNWLSSMLDPWVGWEDPHYETRDTGHCVQGAGVA